MRPRRKVFVNVAVRKKASSDGDRSVFYDGIRARIRIRGLVIGPHGAPADPPFSYLAHQSNL